jgi:hypothetical protein
MEASFTSAEQQFAIIFKELRQAALKELDDQRQKLEAREEALRLREVTLEAREAALSKREQNLHQQEAPKEKALISMLPTPCRAPGTPKVSRPSEEAPLPSSEVRAPKPRPACVPQLQLKAALPTKASDIQDPSPRSRLSFSPRDPSPRLSTASVGSTSRLKVMFEEKASAPATAAQVASESTPSRVTFRRVQPSPAIAAAASALQANALARGVIVNPGMNANLTTPQKRLSLQELLRLDEERRCC